MKQKIVKQSTIVKLIRERAVIPDGECGNYKITHRVIPARESVCVVSMRNAIFMGYKPWNAIFNEPLTVRSLCYDGGTWMTDHPCELWQMDEAVKKLRGRVLIGGLGLGIATTMAENRARTSRSRITQVNTVEISREVYGLVAPHVLSPLDRITGGIIVDNLYAFLRRVEPGHYDSAFFDIWQSTGEMSWTGHVVPLRRLARGKIKNVVCWLEDEMCGQMGLVLYRAADFSDEIDGPIHYATFLDAVRSLGIRKSGRITPHIDATKMFEIEIENRNDPKLQGLVHLFMRPGTDTWERIFGEHWDRHLEEERSNADETADACVQG